MRVFVIFDDCSKYFSYSNGPAHEILALITYAQMPPLNVHAYIASQARSLDFGQNLYQHPYVLYMRCEGSGETVSLRRLVEPSLLAYAISTKSHVLAQKIF